MSGVWGLSCVCRRWVSRKGNGFVRLWMCCGPFFVVGVPFCGMCMDRTNAFLRGRCNDFVMAWTCKAFHAQIATKWWRGRHLVTSPFAAAVPLWIAWKNLFTVGFLNASVRVCSGCGFRGRATALRCFGGRFCNRNSAFRVVTAVPLGVCSQRCSHRCAYKNLKGSAQFLGGVYLRCRPVIAVPIEICTLSTFSKSWRDLRNSMAQCTWAQSLLCV